MPEHCGPGRLTRNLVSLGRNEEFVTFANCGSTQRSPSAVMNHPISLEPMSAVIDRFTLIFAPLRDSRHPISVLCSTEK